MRPILEYSIQAASPYLQKDIDYVEQLQRLGTRLVKGLRGRPYHERLNTLNLFSLSRRRLRGDLITAYNIFNGRISIKPEALFDSPHAAHLRGHPFKMKHKKFTISRRKAAFSLRIAKPWNSLPSSIVTAGSINAFKQALDTNWSCLFSCK